MGPIRTFVFGPLLGGGMVAADGTIWEHSRAMTSPTFARPQFATLTAFDVHVAQLLENIPRDGSTVDLQPLFNRLALDSTTEMLFGASVQSLTPVPPPRRPVFP